MAIRYQTTYLYKLEQAFAYDPSKPDVMTFNFVDQQPTKVTMAYVPVNSRTVNDWWVVNTTVPSYQLNANDVAGTDPDFTGFNDTFAFDFGSGYQGINAAVRGGKLFDASHTQMPSANNLMTVFKMSDGSLWGTLSNSTFPTSGWSSIRKNFELPKTWEFTQASDITGGHGQSTQVGEDVEADNLADFYANGKSGSGSRAAFFAAESPLCFARGTLIQTDVGEKRIEDLREDDLVLTRDNGLQPIRWIGSTTLPQVALDLQPKLRPIRIKAGALGSHTPKADLLVSPQHRVLVRSKIAARMFGASEVLVAAKHLCEIDGIDIAEDVAEIEYFHMLFDQHEVVLSNGAETESLFTGPEALSSVGEEAKAEILTLFPHLEDPEYADAFQAARFLVPGRRGKSLARRHDLNDLSLVD